MIEENNGHSALSRINLEARKAPIQGVLLDLQMPMFDRIAVLHELRDRHQEMPVIVMSATDDMTRLEKAIKLGAREYLTKPLHPELLREQCLRIFLNRS